jgi:predicted metal-dependent phosphoesterase TrpH
MGYADLHIHTIHSHDGTCSVPAILKYAADYTNLNIIAITDHDTTAGVKEAMLLAPHYDLQVIPGIEVTTAEGHLLALFITQPVPTGLSLVESVRLVGEMGGLCIAPHPDGIGSKSLSTKSIRAAMRDPEVARIMVGVEAFNGGMVFTRTHNTALRLALSVGAARVGSSDSHILHTIGEGKTYFPGSTIDDLRAALLARTTQPYHAQNLSGIKALLQWVPNMLVRKLGWVTWNAYPNAPLTYTRMNSIVEK